MWLEKITFKWVQNLMPFPGFIAMTVLPFIFIKKSMKEYYDEYVNNHEMIHIYQQFECLFVTLLGLIIICLSTDLSWWWLFASIVSYYVIYILFWVVTGFSYYTIPFEREAYDNEKNLNYLNERKWFSCFKYIIK